MIDITVSSTWFYGLITGGALLLIWSAVFTVLVINSRKTLRDLLAKRVAELKVLSSYNDQLPGLVTLVKEKKNGWHTPVSDLKTRLEELGQKVEKTPNLTNVKEEIALIQVLLGLRAGQKGEILRLGSIATGVISDGIRNCRARCQVCGEEIGVDLKSVNGHCAMHRYRLRVQNRPFHMAFREG